MSLPVSIMRVAFALFWCVIVAGLPNDRSMHEMLRDAINIFIGRPIRDNGTPNSAANYQTQGPSPSRCAQQCTKYMRECAHNEIPGFEKQMWSFHYDPAKLETYCQIHENGTECLSGCPESIAKSLARKGLDIGRHICNSSAIRTYARCITDVVTPLQDTCETMDRCGKYPLPEGHDIRPTSVDEFRQLTRQTCLRLKCNLDCVSSSVINRCGVVAEQNVETVVRTAARYLKVLTETLKVPRAYASECGLLANVTDAL